MPTVFVTQLPSRREHGVWIPILDITSAKSFGDLHILSPSGLNYATLQQIMPVLCEKLSAFKPEDFLLPLGDPLLMSLASAFLGSQLKTFNILKWDRKEMKYYSYTVSIAAKQ